MDAWGNMLGNIFTSCILEVGLYTKEDLGQNPISDRRQLILHSSLGNNKTTGFHGTNCLWIVCLTGLNQICEYIFTHSLLNGNIIFFKGKDIGAFFHQKVLENSEELSGILTFWAYF